MLVLAISKRKQGFAPQRLGELQAGEAKAVWELYLQGKVRQFWFDAEHQPEPKGILLIEADCLEHARTEVIDRLPLVAEGLIDFDLYVLGPYAALNQAFSA